MQKGNNMQTQQRDEGVERETMKPEKERQAKNQYRSPRLVVYGDLHRLTMGVSGTKGDGSSGHTRS